MHGLFCFVFVFVCLFSFFPILNVFWSFFQPTNNIGIFCSDSQLYTPISRAFTVFGPLLTTLHLQSPCFHYFLSECFPLICQIFISLICFPLNTLRNVVLVSYGQVQKAAGVEVVSRHARESNRPITWTITEVVD